jgi:tRNA-uridine 2-sulfurtransferase
MKQRVIALMSGGVDSSVAAALLKEQGYEVIGVYILGWTGIKDFPCAWQQEEADARAVAAKLGIPFHTINLSPDYGKLVIDEFFNGYRQGVTPNPDILCNKEIKFKALWEAVRQLEPDYLATGHYARLRREIPNTKSQNPNKSHNHSTKPDKQGDLLPAIFQAVDEDKDQTYFLWAVDRSMLRQILFPLGELTKTEVRQLARKFGLKTADKKDSQGICFVGPLKVREFLKTVMQPRPGQAVLGDGRIVGEHQGVQLYTIGQRLGAGSVEWTGDVPPLFVAAKDLKSNRLIVGPDEGVYASSLVAGDANWFRNPPGQHFEAMAQTRYRQEPVAVSVSVQADALLVNFQEPVRALTAGQSIVFYQKEQLLGGALIKAVPEQELLVERLYGQQSRFRPSIGAF